MKTEKHLLISQSLIKDVLPQSACPKQIGHKYIEGQRTPPSELMLRGQYFEHHLIGATRGGEVPELTKLKKGGKSQAEKDLEELITYARIILDAMKLDVSKGESQVEIQVDGLEGHIDHINTDIQNPARKAIYDVKYTETKYDDRWNGWADFESLTDAKIQAAQYVKLYHAMHGQYIPYYFLIFGKSFWCRIIKVVVTAAGMAIHNNRIDITKERMMQWNEEGWPAKPEFYKCLKCHFSDKCKFVATIPDIETYQI